MSFVNLDGIRHSVKVEAEGLYEASVLGLCAFRTHELELGGLTRLDVEVRSSITHTLTVTKVREWLQRGVRTTERGSSKRKTSDSDLSLNAFVPHSRGLISRHLLAPSVHNLSPARHSGGSTAGWRSGSFNPL